MTTYDEAGLSDLYKDVWGIRPPEGFWRHWNESMAIEKQKIWDVLESVRSKEAAAIASFEELVSTWQQSLPYATRADCCRYIEQAHGLSPEEGYTMWEGLEYDLALPFGYIAKTLA